MNIGPQQKAPVPASKPPAGSTSKLRRQHEVLLELARTLPGPAADTRSQLERIAAAASRRLEVERVSVWLFDEARQKLRCIELYERSLDRHSSGMELLEADYPLYFQALETERALAAHKANTDPRTAEFSGNYLAKHNISSMLDAPIRLRGSLVGVVCHEHVGPGRRWTVEEENFAGSIADLAAAWVSEMERYRAEQTAHFQADLLAEVSDAIIAADESQRVTYWNRAAERLYGIPAREALGRPVTENFQYSWLNPETEAKARESLAKLGFWRGENIHRKRNGDEIIVESSVRALRGGTTPAGFLAVIRDVTERKRDEQERARLAEQIFIQRQRLRDIVRSVAGVVWEAWWQADGSGWQCDFVSDYAERMLGYPLGDWLTQPNFLLKVVHPLDRERTQRALEQLKSDGGGRFECRWVAADGTVLWVESRVECVTHDRMEAAGLRGVTMDMTERKRTEFRLTLQHEVNQVLAQAPEDVTRDLMRVLCERLNWDLAEVWHLDRGAGVLRQSGSWDQHSPELADFVMRSRELTFAHGTGLPGRVWASGQPAWISDLARDPNFPRQAYAAAAGLKSAVGFPVRLSGEVVGVIELFSRDFREPDENLLGTLAILGNQIGLAIERRTADERVRLELERRVQERTAALQETNAQMEAFCYSVSHDLRAPLRAMQGFSQALLEDVADRLGPEGEDYCRRILKAGAHMDGLIQDLLRYSRLSRIELVLEPVDLGLVLDQVQKLQEGEISRRQGILTITPPLPSVVGQRVVLEQVLGNLISNAVKFMAPDQAPQVRIWSEDRGEFSRLWVADNGIGIATEHQTRIFRVFERLHSSEIYPGSGIGLAIVKKGVERLGGRVGVESAAGQGSRFWIELRKA